MVKVQNTKVPKMKVPSQSAPKKKDASKGGAKPGMPELSVLQSWLTFSTEAARKKHWEYFVIDQFIQGNHDVRGNPNDNSIQIVKRTDSVSYPINQVYAVHRALKAFVTKNKPFIAVEPEDFTDEAKQYARRSNRILERDNQLNNYRKINKEWAYLGTKYGLGWRQIGYDTEKQCAVRWTVSPWDLVVGAKSGDPLDAPYLIKNVVRTIGYLIHKFPELEGNIAPDNLMAYDEYERLSMQLTYPDQGASAQPITEQTKILHECWYRVFEENSRGGLINKCYFVDEMAFGYEETPYTEYPFIPYHAEVVPNAISTDSYLKQTLSPQRMLNLLNTQELEYNHIVNRGKIMIPRGSGVRVIQAKEGQIITYKPGKAPTVMNPPAINPSLENQKLFAADMIREIGGQNDASSGIAPFAGASGAAIEKLQAADSNNVSDLRDNFEDALALEATWILKMYSLFETKGLTLNAEVKTGQYDTFTVFGEEGMKNQGRDLPEKYFMEANGSYNDVCAVLPDNHVKVSVRSQLGETQDAKLDLLFKLKDAGLPLLTILQYLEFPNASDIMERIADEAVAEMAAQKIQQPLSADLPVNQVSPDAAPMMDPAMQDLATEASSLNNG